MGGFFINEWNLFPFNKNVFAILMYKFNNSRATL